MSLEVTEPSHPGIKAVNSGKAEPQKFRLGLWLKVEAKKQKCKALMSRKETKLARL